MKPCRESLAFLELKTMPEILIPSQSEVDWLATPYVHDPTLAKEAQDILLEGMIVRALALSEFLAGRINYEDYLQSLTETGVDPIDFHEGLEDGLCCL